MLSALELFALDGVEQVAKINTPTRVEIVERDLDSGAWLIDLPLDDEQSVAARLASADRPGFEAYDPATGWRFGGYLTNIRETRTRTSATVTFSGKDFQSKLANRLDWPIYNDLDAFWSNVSGGTIPLTGDALVTVLRNCGRDALEYRRIADISFEADPNVGAPKARRLKGIPVLDVLRTMFTGEPWTARLRLLREADASTTNSSLRFSTPERQVADLLLSAELGNIGAIEVIDEADIATMAIGMGGEEVDDLLPRFVSSAQDPGGWQTWQHEYVETFLNRPGTDNQADLDDETQTHLIELANGPKVKVSDASVEGFGQRVDIGWLVPVALSSSFDVRRVHLPVAASKVTFRPDEGWKRTIDVGREVLGNSPAALMQQLGVLARRVRQLESELYY